MLSAVTLLRVGVVGVSGRDATRGAIHAVPDATDGPVSPGPMLLMDREKFMSELAVANGDLEARLNARLSSQSQSDKDAGTAA